MQTNGHLSNYINGQWARSTTDEYETIVNPATGEQIAQVPLSGAADINAAVEAAVQAFPEWRRTPPEERIQSLFKFKQLLEDHFEEIAHITTKTAKPSPRRADGLFSV
jgi:malonate-semialdehyde dehydrogenase (acetylating)/methylmalonate-semialdehyde dehydrogenase